MKKRISTYLIIFLVILCLCACTKAETSENTNTITEEETASETTEETQNEINFNYNQILERLKFLIEDDKKNNKHKMETLKNNGELLELIKKGEL